MAVTRESP
jgi:hypothetical protein